MKIKKKGETGRGACFRRSAGAVLCACLVCTALTPSFSYAAASSASGESAAGARTQGSAAESTEMEFGGETIKLSLDGAITRMQTEGISAKSAEISRG